MTSIFDESGKNISCTVIEAAPNVVTQVKNIESDGYDAIQVGYGDKKSKNTSASMRGHFEKAGTNPKARLAEFDLSMLEKDLGDEISIQEIFEEGDFVNVVGTSKGKGFQGVVKRHGFGGVGDATHGQHNRMRAPGAIGACATPSKVVKGMKMAGRTGGKRVKTLNLKVIERLE